MAKKTYIGTVTAGECDWRVTVIRDDLLEPPHPLNPRFDLVNHSPAGFAWGYCGSGPSQLALAILCDHLTEHPEDEQLAELICSVFAVPEEARTSRADALALGFYQEFKRFFIATLDQDLPFMVTNENVHELLEKMAKACHGLR